jgi:hypothetical protein
MLQHMTGANAVFAGDYRGRDDVLAMYGRIGPSGCGRWSRPPRDSRFAPEQPKHAPRSAISWHQPSRRFSPVSFAGSAITSISAIRPFRTAKLTTANGRPATSTTAPAAPLTTAGRARAASGVPRSST